MTYLEEHWIILSLVLIYLLFCLGIGWWFKHKASKGTEEYFIARREIPGWVISLAFFSTFASTNTYIGQAGQAFAAGLCWAWVGVFWTVLCIISWLVLGPRMRNQTASLNSVTIPDYLDNRYKSSLSSAIRMLAAFTILFATIWYMSGIAKGCAHLLDSVLDIPYHWGALLIIGITCAYTVLGGMYSVLWTDAVQGIMMFAVAILMFLLPFIHVGSVSELMARISETTHVARDGLPMGNGLVTFCTLVPFLYVLGIGLAVGMKQVSEPRCLIRFYSVDNTRSMKFAMIWTPVFLGISLVCVMGLGALVHAMATEKEAAVLIQDTDQVVGFMLKKFDSQLVSGICVAGLFAAGMSSLASVTLIVGTAFVGDVLQTWRPLERHEVIPHTRAAMAAYCGIVFLVTVIEPEGIVELTAFAGAVFASSFFPAIFGGLYLRWGTGHGAFWSMLIGIVSCVVWRFGFRQQFESLRGVHEIIPSVAVSLLSYVVISRITRRSVPDEEHLARVFTATGRS